MRNGRHFLDRARPASWRLLLSAVLLQLCWPAFGAERFFDATFKAEIKPRLATILVELKLSGDRLPSKVEFHTDPERQRAFASKHPITRDGDVVTWSPSGHEARITYEFVATHEHSKGRYDSLVADDWAVFRGDKMVPRITVTSQRSLKGRTKLTFALPPQWSAATAYPQDGDVFDIDDSNRKIDRPTGWMLAGKLGKRSEIIKGVQTLVAAPSGDNSRRQDLLAFLNWNLPHLKDVFPDFPQRLLVVTAGDPMWRGGLSGPGSLFIHADRPLISENRTSTLLHELVHVAMGIRGDEESDWIAEGFAEYYSLEILRRSGGVGKARYAEALERMAEWARESPSVFAKKSTGANTARAVIALRAADLEIRKLSEGRASLDDVASSLAKERGEVTLQVLQAVAKKVAGADVKALHRARLSAAQPS